MLPPDEVERRLVELDTFARDERLKTIANMSRFGKPAMDRWFPQGVSAYLAKCFPHAK